MALDENLRLPDLLAPIPGESPVGPDLKYSNEFSEIEWLSTRGRMPSRPTIHRGFLAQRLRSLSGGWWNSAPIFC